MDIYKCMYTYMCEYICIYIVYIFAYIYNMNMPKTEYELKLFIIKYLLHILCC